jgi:hypothetical protein
VVIPHTGTLPGVVASAVAAIALFLLVASGLGKLTDPGPTTGAMGAARLPASRALTYTFGVIEILAASLGLLLAGIGLAVSAALYAAFSIFTLAAVRKRIPVQSCGCFGREDTPPSLLHVAFNAGATIALTVSVLYGLSPIEWSASLLELTLYVGFALFGAYSSYLLLTRLPQLIALIRTP